MIKVIHKGLICEPIQGTFIAYPENDIESWKECKTIREAMEYNTKMQFIHEKRNRNFVQRISTYFKR